MELSYPEILRNAPFRCRVRPKGLRPDLGGLIAGVTVASCGAPQGYRGDIFVTAKGMRQCRMLA